MAINLAQKYSSKVDEQFKLKSLTASFGNRNYDWSGVATVQIYSIPTVALNDYVRTGANRYGTPSELQDNLQECTVKKDRSFTYTIDRGNKNDQMMVKDAGKSLRQQIDTVVVPEIDTYRLGVICASGIANSATGVTVPSATNAYASFLDGQIWLDEHKVPLVGRISAITPVFYKFLKLDPSFIKTGDMSQKIVINGLVGEVDNVKLVKMPSSYLPANTNFMITHPIANVFCDKLSEYKIHNNPPGINGWLIEGRVIYDCFVLNMKKDACYVSTSA